MGYIYKEDMKLGSGGWGGAWVSCWEKGFWWDRGGKERGEGRMELVKFIM